MNHMTALESRVLMSFGQLDPGFDLDGLVRTNAVDGTFTAVKHLPDNRILAAGHSDGRGVLAMYTAQGQLDPAFGNGGMVQVTPAAVTTISDIEVDAQNRIIVGGNVKFFVGDDEDLFVSAYTMDGSLVSGYGRTGAGTTFFDFLGWEMAGGLALMPDGGVVLGGTSASIISTFAALKLDANGIPDPNFGSQGYARPSIGTQARGRDIAVQADGKIVIVGHSRKTNSDPEKFAVVRLNNDGSYDTSFAGDGKFIIESVPGVANARSVTIDHKNRIVIGGTARLDSTVDFAAVRVLSTGALDTSFATSGIATYTFGFEDFAESVSVMKDNTVVLAGWSDGATGGTPDMNVVRFRENGTLDNTFAGSGASRRHFGGEEQLFAVTTTQDGGIIAAGASDGDLAIVRYRGYTRTDFGNGGYVADFESVEPVILNAVTTQPDGKIIAAGYVFNVPGGVSGAFRIQRHLPDGSLDPSFGAGGIRDIDAIPVSDDDGAIDVAVAPDGTIYALGMDYVNNADHWIVASLDSSGNPITSFGSNGVVSFRPGGATFSTPAGIKVQPDGKIVLAGSIVPGGRQDRDIALVRLDTGGNLDVGFGTSGVSSIRLTNGATDGFDTASALALFDDGSIAVSGTTSLYGGNMVAAVFTPAGQPDTSFAVTGWRILDDVPGNTTGEAIAIDAQQRIIIAGSSRPSIQAYTELAVARLLRSGGFDNTFAGNGNDVLPLGSTINTVSGVGVMPNGKIVLTGSTNHGGPGSNVLLARWNFNGSRDLRLTSLTPFSTRAVASFDVEGRNDYANGMTILLDGDVVVAGRSDFRGLVARFTSETAAVGGAFIVDAPTQRIVVQFNANVRTSLRDNNLILVERNTLTLIDGKLITYDDATNRATIEFPTLPNGVLPDGQYRLSIDRHAVTDLAGNPLAVDFQLLFDFLNGDANRDGVVNLADFNRLAANFGQTGRTFSQGDFNYDGVVNLQDFNILAGRFGQTIGQPSTAASGASASSGTSTFSSTRVSMLISDDEPASDVLV